MSEPEAPWQVLKSRLIHDGSPWIQVFQDTVQTGSGLVVEDFHRIEAKDFALVFAQDAQGRVIMLRQWRQGPRRFALSFPGGHVEPGEDPAVAGLRELTEETGFKAESVRSLGRFCMHSNLGLGWGNFFITQGVTKISSRSTGDLEIAAVRRVTISELETATSNGSIATVHDALCAQLGLTG
jgi:ADP-ribose pyrophosphatase